MLLKQFLKDRNITQVNILAETLKAGRMVYPGDLSKFVNGKFWSHGFARRIRAAVVALGVPDTPALDEIAEFKPRL